MAEEEKPEKGKTQAEPESNAPSEKKEEEAKPEAPAPKEEKPEVKEKKVEKKGKRVRTGRKHESTKVYVYFDGKAGKRLKVHCPRCGPGTWLSSHKNRSYCGRCGYTEFEKKKPAE